MNKQISIFILIFLGIWLGYQSAYATGMSPKLSGHPERKNSEQKSSMVNQGGDQFTGDEDGESASDEDLVITEVDNGMDTDTESDIDIAGKEAVNENDAAAVDSTLFKGLTQHQSAETYDSLLSKWYETNIVSSHDRFFDEFIDIDSASLYSQISQGGFQPLPDSVYKARLSALVSPIQLGYNEVIKRHIISYTRHRNNIISKVLGLSQIYFPMIEEELAKEGLPLELRMLPVIESGLNPSAVSRVGARGLWQFMYGTGKAYGLEITSFIDQRSDPVLSTKAACKYLKDLYNMYNDWTLAIAAYNCGPGNVNKALKRAGDDAKNFWDIYPYLPRETRGYIPSFVAATYAYTFHQQHQINFNPPPIPISTDTIMVSRIMHLEQVSSTIETPIETLRALNPQYKLDIIPAAEKRYALTLPQSDVAKYIACEGDIMAKDTVFLADYIKQPAESLAKVISLSSVTYKIKSGDTLGAIARKYGVTVAQIMKWNNLKNANTLRVGQRIEIFR